MSAGEIPTTRILSVTPADPQKPREPYSTIIGKGEVRVFQANFVLVGTAGAGDVFETVSVMTGASGCPCGCKIPGRAFEYRPTPDEARTMARQLIEAADQVDAAAHAQARDFIGKVRKL